MKTEPEESPQPSLMARELSMRLGGAVASPTVTGITAVTAGLKVALERCESGATWRLLSGYQLRLRPSGSARLLPNNLQPSLAPFQAEFGPLTLPDAKRLAASSPHIDAGLAPLLTSEQLSVWDLWVVYENDGTGIVPNFGSGSDQARTAALYISARKRTPAVGLTRIGVTPIEMTTPRGTLPAGTPFSASSTYETPPGPYSGVVSLDVGVTVYRHGGTNVEVFGSAGVDSTGWGKLVQDTIHTKVSGSPLFPWPTGTKPLADLGVAGHQSLNEIMRSDFRGLTYAGRLEFDQSLVTGTRRAEGSLRARFVIRTAALRTPLGPLSMEFSPAGVLTRAFLRYNDGRVAVLAGVEAAISSSMMVNLGRVGLGLAGEMLLSTDPAFQTPLEAGSAPTATTAFGWLSSGPLGHHGTGQLIFRIGF
jgi:hypothetical protein